MRPTRILALILLTTLATAESPQDTPPPQTTLQSTTTIVLVPTLVKTKAGAPVFTLTAADFLLTDDGRPQPATLEEDADTQPLALVVCIETGAAGARHLDLYRRLGPLIESVVGAVPHRVAVVAFDSEPALVQPFTANLDRVGTAASSLEPGDGGGAIRDALAYAVDLLRDQSPAYRRAILLLSETVDHGSHEDLDTTLRTLNDTNTAIYSIAFSSSRSDAAHEAAKMITSDPEPGPPGGCMAKDPTKPVDPTSTRLSQTFNCLALLLPPLRLAKVATILAGNSLRRNVPETAAQLTGGEYLPFTNERSLERDLVAIANHLHNRYILSFHPAAPHPGLHILAVHLPEQPDLLLTSKSSYYAATPARPVP